MARLKNDGKGRLGGRTVGTPNKVTKELRSLMSDLAKEDFEIFKLKLLSCKPADFCSLYIAMCKFILPSLSAVDINDTRAEENSFSGKLREMRKEIEKEVE
ncbi:MAG: hypothetical protein RRY36_09370 [Bacteroidaceae bacterium]